MNKDQLPLIDELIPSNGVIILILFTICLLSTNNYFGYHSLSAIADDYQIAYNLNTFQFGTLFTVYSAPNIVLVYFSGILIDTYGVRRTSQSFNSVILLGLLLCALTPFPSSSISPTAAYTCLLIGRLLLGLGGESICACASTMISKWFSKGDHLNTAMAVNQAVVQLLGSSSAFYILPHLRSVLLAQWFTVGVGVMSLLAAILYSWLEQRYEQYLNEMNYNPSDNIKAIEVAKIKFGGEEIPLNSNLANSTTSPYKYTILEKDSDVSIQTVEHSSCSSWLNIVYKNCFSVLFSFPLLFWLVLFHVALLSPILYTFTAFGPLYLQESFPSTQSPEDAGNATSLLYLAIVAAPFTGVVIDWLGRRAFIQAIATLGIPIIFLLLAYQIFNPFLSMFLLGLIYSITEANSFAMVSLIVPTEKLGTAFGLIGCAISIALLFEPAAVGYLRQISGSFTSSIWLFIILSIIGNFLAFIIFFYDKLHSKILSS